MHRESTPREAWVVDDRRVRIACPRCGLAVFVLARTSAWCPTCPGRPQLRGGGDVTLRKATGVGGRLLHATASGVRIAISPAAHTRLRPKKPKREI